MTVRALNLYYARDASARPQVLATRRRASDVRISIGIPRGRIFIRHPDNEGAFPDVMWDCVFPDARAHDQDMQARAASADFEGCRATMRTLTRRFERIIYAQVETGASPEAPPAERIIQVWLTGDTALDFEALRSDATPTMLLYRTDDNARLPDWIVEVPASVGDDQWGTIKAWIGQHPMMRATTLLWYRAD